MWIVRLPRKGRHVWYGCFAGMLLDVEGGVKHNNRQRFWSIVGAFKAVHDGWLRGLSEIAFRILDSSVRFGLDQNTGAASVLLVGCWHRTMMKNSVIATFMGSSLSKSSWGKATFGSLAFKLLMISNRLQPMLTLRQLRRLLLCQFGSVSTFKWPFERSRFSLHPRNA